ncbi:MAG: DUF1156 domain-containing protein [Candidatus Rokubacteria bacterium]|nr:DUF1156 domain-containing protein [Candidatus Rokubacteria bacterium]
MTTRKKLIEVALPLKAINEASAREKSVRHGQPTMLCEGQPPRRLPAGAGRPA